MMGDASFASSVHVIDKKRGVNETAEISMNNPLVYGRFTFYQSGHDNTPDGRPISILSVSIDPGRYLKYLGGLMTCLGVFLVFYKKAFFALVGYLAKRRRATACANASGTTVGTVVLALLVLAGGATGTSAGEKDAATFHWRQWQSLPVQEGGRQKPLDTLARETFRTISNQSSFVDPETKEQLDSTGLYLVLLFTGRSWDRPTSPHGMMGGAVCPAQPTMHKPDAWDREPLLLVNSAALREALGMPADQKYISFVDLGHAEIEVPRTGAKDAFLAWAQKLSRGKPRGLSDLEKKGVELADRYRTFQDVRRGQKLEILPVEESKEQEWLSLPSLIQAKWGDRNDPTGQIREAKDQLQKARAAYLAKNAETFNAASAAFIAAMREIGPQLGDYPSAEIIDLEVVDNHWSPFRIAWICTLAALLCMLLTLASRWRPFYLAALAFYGAGVLVMLVGFTIRVIIAGRAPVTNMYESVVFVGLGTALFGLIFQLVYRKNYVLTAAAAVSTLALALADTCFDPSIQPLNPVLRNNFWLVAHVMTIMLSYADFALAWLIGNITLGFLVQRRANRRAIAVLTKLTYKFLQAGVLLLIIGTFLGAWWADYAWGRFWGWDPKEVWALITLMFYLALLHARRVGWAGDLGLAAFSVVCFASIVMAWYGVNYVLATGLHSYGSGSGGQGYVLAAGALQLVYVGAAALHVAFIGWPSETSASQA